MAHKKSWLSKTIWGFGLTSFFNDFSHEMCTAILPAFMQQLMGTSYTPTALGLVAGISNGASTGMKLLSGLLADHLRTYKPLLSIGYAVTPLFSGLIGTAHALWQILLYKTVAWMGRGLREPIRDTWLSRVTKKEFYGRVFGFQRALDTLGAIAGPLVAYYALTFYSLETIFLISFIPGILSVISLITLTQEPTEFVHESGPKSEHENRSADTKNSLHYRFKQLPHNFRNFLYIIFIFGLSNFNKTLLIFRAQEILTGQQNSTLVATGLAIALYTFFNIIRAIGEFSVGALSDFMSRKNLLAVLGFGLFACSSLGLIYKSTNIFWWLFIFACAGLSTGTITTLEKSHAADLLPADQRGFGFGVLQAADGVSDLISNILVGALWSFISPTAAFIYSGLLSILATILLLF